MTNASVLFPELTEMFKRILGERIDQSAKDFVDLFAKDGVMEFPYAVEGRPKRVAGAAALRSYLEDLNTRFEVQSHSEPTVHWTLNPAIVIVEFSIEACLRGSGESHNQVYIDVITLEDRKIANFRDYWNPMLTSSYVARS